MSQRRTAGLILVVIAIYSSMYAKGYVLSALGMNPQLDAAEMILLASQIAAGTLPREPFYRAPGFAFLLALILKLGASVTALPLLAAVLNWGLHLGNCVLVYAISRAIGAQKPSACVAMAMYGLYPVSVYFMAEPLDITLAISLLLLGTWAALIADARHTAELKGSLPAVIAMGLAFGFATWARPQLILIGVLAFVWVFWRLRHQLAQRIAMAIALLLPLYLMGSINESISGEFRMLPWQGSYSLYAANGADADARFFSQRHSIKGLLAGQNPTRAESYARFEELSGERARSITELNQFWKARMVDEVFSHPARYATLIAKRAFYAFNRVEQYNNKTYSYQSQQFALLRYNPLGFGIVLVLGVVGLALSWRDPRARFVALLALGVVATLLITWPSDRFRLPMVPLLLCLATGLQFSSGKRWAYAFALPALIVAFWPISARERDLTHDSDALLWGNAHAGRGELESARTFYAQTLPNSGMSAGRHDALCRLEFNGWLTRHPQALKDWPNQQTLKDCQAGAVASLESGFVHALVLAMRGAPELALAALEAVQLGSDDRLRGRSIVAQAQLKGADLNALRLEFAEIGLSPDPAIWVALGDPRAELLSPQERSAATRLWAAFGAGSNRPQPAIP